MRRTYISPEFDYKPIFGTMNMLEQSSFFGSKMLEIEDKIDIKNENIIFYQLNTKEQLDFDAERNLPQIIYDAVNDKGINHVLFIDESQTQTDMNNNTKWIADIEIQKILRNYLFATMKKYRTFEGVRNNMTISNNVDSALYEYIDRNVLSRYKFTKVEMFIKYIDILTVGGLRYKNIYDAGIEGSTSLFTKIQTETDANDLDIRIKFYQEKPSSQYSFKYYYNIYFEKL
jgi:hypothetical protein